MLVVLMRELQFHLDYLAISSAQHPRDVALVVARLRNLGGMDCVLEPENQPA